MNKENESSIEAEISPDELEKINGGSGIIQDGSGQIRPANSVGLQGFSKTNEPQPVIGG